MTWRDLLKQAEEARLQRRYHDALQLSDRAAQQGEDARYHAALIRGDTLLEIGDAASALSTYDSVADPAVPDPELDCARGIALFELAKLPEAENALRSAVRGNPELADAYFTLGLIAEITGTGEETELFRVARRLDAARFPATPQLSRRMFEDLVEEALAELSGEVQAALSTVPVLVADVPHPEDLRRSVPPVPPTSFGMFVGLVELTPQGWRGNELDPPAILLFKRNLERAFPEPADLVSELRHTVETEIGRVLGLESETD